MKTTKHLCSLALGVGASFALGCNGALPAVPPVEFRLNSPAPPSASTVYDNHHEVNQNVHVTSSSIVLAPQPQQAPASVSSAPTPQQDRA